MRNKISEILATNILGWKKKHTTKGIRYVTSNNVLVEKFHPYEDMNDAMLLANKLGICLVPQSTDTEGYYWLASDIEKVSYNGETVAITPIEHTIISCKYPAEAISIAALSTLKEYRDFYGEDGELHGTTRE